MCLLITAVSIDGILAELEGKHVLASYMCSPLPSHVPMCLYEHTGDT